MKIAIQGKNKGGNVEIYLRVYNPQTLKQSLKHTGHTVPEKFWDKKNKKISNRFPNADLKNEDIQRQLQEAEKNILIVKKTSGITDRKVKAVLKKQGNIEDFLAYFKEHLDRIKLEFSDSYWKQVNTVYEQFSGFVKKQCTFADIDSKLLREFQNRLFGEEDNIKNTVSVKMGRLLMIINLAIDDRLISADQIRGYKAPSYESPGRDYLTMDDLDTILNHLEDGEFNNDPSLKKVVPFFLVECLCGIRFSDWHRFKLERLIKDESLKVRTKKTGEPVYYPLHKADKLKKVLKFIADNEIVFDLTEQQANRTLKLLQTYLPIDFELTTHIGRHTCATLHLEIGYSKEAVAEILGISMRTVEIYARITRRKLRIEYDKYGGI